jgi:multiple sugar transport system permease protein
VNTVLKKKYDNGTAYSMLFPVVGLLTVFVIIPFIYSLYVSFYDWSFYQDSIFVGFDNFKMVLKDRHFYSAIGVGLKFALYVVPIQMVLSFLLALLIRNLRGKSASFVKTSIYIPTILSGILASIIFGFLYNYDAGLFNYILSLFGVEKQSFLGDVKTALISLALPGIWLGFGISSLIMLAGLLDIPETYYEAAELEGANAFNKMIYITVPLMKNIFLFLLITGFIGAIQQLELPLFLTNGGPDDATLTPNLYLLNHFKGDTLMGHTIAAALLLFVVLGSISAIIFKIINSDKAIDG